MSAAFSAIMIVVDDVHVWLALFARARREIDPMTRRGKLVLCGVAMACVIAATPARRHVFAAASNNDADAGTWRMIVLSPPTANRGPAPSSTTAPSYQAELAAIKARRAA